ncbi:MAG: hypothetical protein H7831_01175 [Magnetococcus sp. WYHC-3]
MSAGGRMPWGRQQGSLLVALSLGMVAFGAFVSALIYLLPSATSLAHMKTVRALEADVNGVLGHVAATRRLPTAAELNSTIHNRLDGVGGDMAYAYNATLAGIAGVCSLGSTGLSLNVAGSGTVTDVAFVLWSNGTDGKTDNATAAAHTKVAGAHNGTDMWNVTAPDPVATADGDDVVRWSTLAELRLLAECDRRQ